MKNFKEREKELLISSLDLSITSVSNSISQVKEEEQRVQLRNVIKELLALSDKIASKPETVVGKPD
jgi:hypothetical protein